jgi:hypothetical protein
MIKYLIILTTFLSLSAMAVDKKDWEEIHAKDIETKEVKEAANKQTIIAETSLRSITKTAVDT